VCGAKTIVGIFGVAQDVPVFAGARRREDLALDAGHFAAHVGAVDVHGTVLTAERRNRDPAPTTATDLSISAPSRALG
jgi:hypothetical protein